MDRAQLDRALVPGARRIAVLRANALGDAIVTLPALAAIRAAYPAAEICLLGKPWHRDFFGARPAPVDRVIVVPVCRNIRDEAGRQEEPRELAAFFAQMRAARLDIAIHLQGDGRSANPFISSLGAGLTAGLRGRGCPPIDRAIPFVYRQHEVLRFLEVAALVGAPPVELEPRVAVTAADLAEARAALGALAGRPLVTLHPGANDLRRLWPAERFARLAELLLARGLAVALTGGAAERDLVARVAAGVRRPGPLADLSGRLSLGGVAGLLALSRLVIANDTGVLHLARAVGAPTVGVIWFPNLVNWAPLSYARHRLAISWRRECPGCGVFPNDPWPFEPKSAACEHWFSFVDAVSLDEVWALTGELLGGERATAERAWA